MTTIIVSPIARLTASRTPPTIPGSAAGMSTLRIVSDVVAPIARLPSRMARGTAAIESSAIEEMNGMIITPITSPAASALSDEVGMPSATASCAPRRDRQRGEIAVDHGRNAREDLEHRLEPGAERGRILGQIDRAITPSGIATTMAMIAPMKIVPQNSGTAPNAPELPA